MELFGLVVTVVVTLGVVVLILLFERKRARRIQRDLRDQGEQQRDARHSEE